MTVYSFELKMTSSLWVLLAVLTLPVDAQDVVVGLEHTLYDIPEGDSVEICAQIISPDDIGSLEFALQIVASDDTPTEGDIATQDIENPIFGGFLMAPGSDYRQPLSGGNFQILQKPFSQSTRSVCYEQLTYNDTDEENDEYFIVELVTSIITPSNILIEETLSRALIRIVDDDGAEVDCPTLSGPSNGGVNIINNEAIYFCSPGFQLEGTETRTCDSSGIWTPDAAPICVAEPLQDISVGFSATLYTTSEDEGSVEISIIISKPTSGGAPRPFSLSLTTQDNTAVSPADYVSVSSQVISFSTGDTSHTVTLSITNDEICEMTDESFSASISLMSGTAPITISPELALIFIGDTDEPECVPTLSLSSETYVAVENEGSVEVCVVLNIPLSFALDFTVTTTDTGSATPGSDYVGGEQFSFLSPGATERCINIGIIDDTALEGNEVFNVELATVFFPVPIDISTAEVTIIDADFAFVGLERTFYQVNESAGSVEVCASVSPFIECPVAAPFNITFTTLNDTADSLNDYIFASVFLQFPPCSGKACASITIIDDDLPETTEIFTVTLERPFGLSSRITINRPRGGVLILDDDLGLSCEADGGVSEVTIDCSGIGPETPLQCSFDGGPLHSCTVPMVLTNVVSPPGSYSVRIEASPGVEATVSYTITDSDSNVVASVPPLQVILIEGYPRVIGNSVEAEFVTSRPVAGARCFLRYLNRREYKDCSSGSVSFTGLKNGRYILKVSAYNRKADVATAKIVVNIN